MARTGIGRRFRNGVGSSVTGGRSMWCRLLAEGDERRRIAPLHTRAVAKEIQSRSKPLLPSGVRGRSRLVAELVGICPQVVKLPLAAPELRVDIAARPDGAIGAVALWIVVLGGPPRVDLGEHAPPSRLIGTPEQGPQGAPVHPSAIAG